MLVRNKSLASRGETCQMNTHVYGAQTHMYVAAYSKTVAFRAEYLGFSASQISYFVSLISGCHMGTRHRRDNTSLH
jgi:hypothetical protein